MKGTLSYVSHRLTQSDVRKRSASMKGTLSYVSHRLTQSDAHQRSAECKGTHPRASLTRRWQVKRGFNSLQKLARKCLCNRREFSIERIPSYRCLLLWQLRILRFFCRWQLLLQPQSCCASRLPSASHCFSSGVALFNADKEPFTQLRAIKVQKSIAA